ncbi:MAG TPA: serine hydrolase domain-containing protein [Terriglobia bacterium]|nr:serine hydrolase domain-containing protein [Terriglobia bacterium]
MKNRRLSNRSLILAAAMLAAAGSVCAQTPKATVKSARRSLAGSSAPNSAGSSARTSITSAGALDFSVQSPESVGFSTERLERLHALMQQFIDWKQIPGMVTILARHGKVIDYRAYGVRDLASGAPMPKDAIFRDFSMTKPVVGVAMMILWEQGKWLPADPIAKYIPEFAHLKVFKGVDADGKMILGDPIHPPTIGELMTHTAGFTYGIFGDTPVDKAYQGANLFGSASLEDFVHRLSKLPLLYQPGTEWVYSVSSDIQGHIVEKLSGQPLPDFLEQNVFKPLGMKDAGFFVPADKRNRFATLYRANGKGELVTDGASGLGGAYTAQPRMPSGGGGMVSTAEDYLRFAQMLDNAGELNGLRVLSPAAVRLMTSNHLPAKLLTGEFGILSLRMQAGFGWGYDGAVEFNPPEIDSPDGQGTFTWGGIGGTWFWVDPTNDIVFVGMIQRVLGPTSPSLESLSRSAVYQALVKPNM